MIEIISSISDFEFYDQDQQTRKLKVKQFYTFDVSTWVSKQIISFNSVFYQKIVIDLIGRTESTKVLSLFWENFNNKELNIFRESFDLSLNKVIEDDERNLSARIYTENNRDLKPIKLAIKQSSNSDICFMVVFYLNYPDKSFKVELYGKWN
jgi:hypothetical protein